METKEIVTIEFRYHDAPNWSEDSGHRTKKILVGVYDTLEEAIKRGNEAISILSEHFEVRNDDWFKEKALWGYPRRLVSNTCYPTKGISYFANITPWQVGDLSDIVRELFEASERYSEWVKRQD